MLRISTWLGKIAIRILYQRILIAMSLLFFKPYVAIVAMLIGFCCAFRAVGIVHRDFRHHEILLLSYRG
jgi:hypothetical protein